MTIHTVLPKRERVDNDMQNVRLPKEIKYISFKQSTSDIHFGVLHINEMNNMDVQFEILFDIKESDRVEYKEKIYTVRKVLLSIKYNKAPLFVAIEQGLGRSSDDLLLLVILKLRSEV